MIELKLVEKTLALGNGLQLSYTESGDRAGLPVLFLHGYSDSWRSYGRLLVQLPSWMRAVAVSVRGHGDSSKPDSAYSVREMSEDLVPLLDVLGIERAVIAGHSMGSLVAQRFAIDHPERMLSLVLMGAFRTVKGHAAAEELWRTKISKLTDPVPAEFVRAFQESTLAKPVPTAFLEMVIGESLKVPAHVWRSAFASMLADDFSGEVPSIHVPALIVWGDQDAFGSHEDQLALASALQDAELQVLPGIGHDPHWEDPRHVAALLTRFLGQQSQNASIKPSRMHIAS